MSIPKDAACVEVRSNAESQIWYEARLMDVDPKTKTVKVSFAVESWEPRVLPAHMVRKPDLSTQSAFEPKVGDAAEVRISGSWDSPPGWSRGKVRSIKGEFYFMSFEASAAGARDLIVERDALRPVNPHQSLDLGKLERALVLIEPQLRHWADSQDAVQVYSQIQERSGLIHVGKVGDSFALMGDSQAVRKGQLLLEVHVKHQKELINILDRKQRKLKELNSRREQYANQVHVEFQVGADLIGLLIGKKGENIQRVMKKHHVEVSVIDGPADMKTIRVSGETSQQVQDARDELEYVNQDYQVDPKMIGWLLGKKMQNVLEIQQKSGIYRARFNQDRGVLVLCGSRQAIEDAVVLLDSHMQYYEIYQEHDRQEFAISRDLHTLQNRRRPPQVKEPEPEQKNRRPRAQEENRSKNY